MLSRIHVIYYADVKTPRKTIGKYIVNVYILYKGTHRHFCEDGRLRKDVTRVHKSSHCHALVSHTLTAITVNLIFVLFDYTLFVYHDSNNSAFHAPLQIHQKRSRISLSWPSTSVKRLAFPGRVPREQLHVRGRGIEEFTLITASWVITVRWREISY